LNLRHFADMKQLWQVTQHLPFAFCLTSRPFLAVRGFLVTNMSKHDCRMALRLSGLRKTRITFGQ
ncbi:hypothetical protein MJH54_29770, partial [Salmonella enterica subsp. enterica serovar Montevideo]|nr:hypothetical protein [Salmonella enterica subsp. enterica serovar Montevideo]